MSRPRPLTELEGTVLGVVWARQPCTPYRVRREFGDSPSPYWSGSAGAIYPLVGRLEAAGLLRSDAHATGRRGSRLYRLTAAGRRALGRWIGPPVPDAVAGVPPDPLRMRIASLGVLPPARRRALLRAIVVGVRRELRLAERDLASGHAGEGLYATMAHGAISMQEARLRWLEEVARRLRRRGRRVARAGHLTDRRRG